MIEVLNGLKLKKGKGSSKQKPEFIHLQHCTFIILYVIIIHIMVT